MWLIRRAGGRPGYRSIFSSAQRTIDRPRFRYRYHCACRPRRAPDAEEPRPEAEGLAAGARGKPHRAALQGLSKSSRPAISKAMRERRSRLGDRRWEKFQRWTETCMPIRFSVPRSSRATKVSVPASLAALSERLLRALEITRRAAIVCIQSSLVPFRTSHAHPPCTTAHS